MMEPTNLLLIMSDEHNPQMLGCAGHDRVQTPHLDALAARGTRFAAAYTTCPICVPARASFATGRYVHTIAYWDNAMAYDGRIKSWGHRLQEAGMRVESIGKLHYRQQADQTGFDQQHIPMHIKDGIGMVQGSIRGQFPDFQPPQGRSTAGGIVPGAGPGETTYTRYDRKIADLACDWLRDAGACPHSRPWVLFVSFVSPHFPLVVPDEYFRLYPVDDMPLPKLDPTTGFEPHPWSARLTRQHAGPEVTRAMKQRAIAAYLGLCTFVDAQIGRVLQALARSGLADRTRVVYTSDHGENAGARGMWGKSVPYAEATGIPLIMAGAGVPAGKVCTTPVTLVDAYPTVLEAVGLEQTAEPGLPGRSLYVTAQADDDPERLAFSEYHAAGSPSGAFMLRQGRYKLHYYVGYTPELFDIVDDPEETRNLAGSPAYAAVVRDYEQRLRAMVDPEAIDARAKADQKALVERHGGPAAVMAKLSGGKNFTEVPPEVVAVL